MEDTLSIGTNASVPNSADGETSDPKLSSEGNGFLSDIDSFEELFTRLETDFDLNNDLVETLANRLMRVEADLPADGSGRRMADPSSRSLGFSSERRPRMSSSQDKIETINDRVEEIKSDIDDLAAEIETVDKSLSSEHESVTDRLDDIETSVDDQHRQLTNEQQRLQSRLNTEFEDLEIILEHLVTRADNHDDDLSRLRAERDALQSLLSEAAEQDAHAGECEVCGEQVDLHLLADPYCPECDSLLTGVTNRSKWLFFSKVVITAEDDRIETSSGSAPQETVPGGGKRGNETQSTQRSPNRPDGHDPTSHPTDNGTDPASGDTAADDVAESVPGSEFDFNDLKNRSDASENKRPDPNPLAEADNGRGPESDTLFGNLGDLEHEEDPNGRL